MEEPPIAIVVPDGQGPVEEGLGQNPEVLSEIAGTLRWMGRMVCMNTTMLVPVMGYVLYRFLVPSS